MLTQNSFNRFQNFGYSHSQDDGTKVEYKQAKLEHNNHKEDSSTKASNDNNHGHSHEHEDQTPSKSTKSLSTSVWLTSLGSICVISLVGLVAVAAIPLLKGPHQDSLLQLLVSLAIGTLVGDALIHLLPHALESEHGENSVVCCWKGFVATMTIIACC